MILFLLAHLLGDYVIQNDWMAQTKTARWWPAVVHGVTYAAAYLLVTRSLAALLVIAGTHIVIDHYRLARHLVWFKNQFAPKLWRYPWRTDDIYAVPQAAGPFGQRPQPFQDDVGKATTFALHFWLMVIADNTVHLFINYAAIRWL